MSKANPITEVSIPDKKKKERNLFHFSQMVLLHYMVTNYQFQLSIGRTNVVEQDELDRKRTYESRVNMSE